MLFKSNLWKFTGLGTVMLLNFSSYPSLATENAITKQGGCQADATLATAAKERALDCGEARAIFDNRVVPELTVTVDVTNNCDKDATLSTKKGGTVASLVAGDGKAIAVPVDKGDSLILSCKGEGRGCTYEVTDVTRLSAGGADQQELNLPAGNN